MVEKAQGGVFSASLGSLKPGEEAVIELAYAQLLSFEQGRIRLVVPTTLAPRYGDPVRQGKLQPDQAAPADLLAEHRFGLSITLAGTAAQARIGSPTHAIAQQRAAGDSGRAGDQVTVSLQGAAWLDRDFVLLLEGLEGRSFAIAGPDPLSGEGHTALIASYDPAWPAQAQAEPAPLRLKILVDCSGSMACQSIAQARDALRPLASRFTRHDEVSYSRFGDRPHRVLGAVAGTPRHIEALIEAIDATDADLGGTEMAAALADTFAVRMGAARHAEGADVLIVTDGEVWDAQRIVDEARRSGHRVYALGVGSAPAESLLREMAEATGGACEFATPHEDMSEAIERLLARVRHVLPVQARLEAEGQPLWSSPLPRRLAAGETVHQFLRLPACPAQAPVLQLAGQAAAPAVLSMRQDDLVARLVAAGEIGACHDKAQARELAERYQLVTEDTNLLLVIERAQADKTDGMPALHAVRPMLAAGWGGTGHVADAAPLLDSQHARSRPRVLRSGTDNIPFMMSMSSVDAGDTSGINVPSVWRTNRTAAAAQIDALASGDAMDYEIPAFLRRQPDTATTARIIAAFNQAAARAQAYRPTLRAVTDLSLDTGLCQLIIDAGQLVGGPLKAWACYLLWLHEGATANGRLDPQALALVQEQLQAVDSIRQAQARELFAAAAAAATA